MSSAPSPEEIAKDARWLAQALDPSAAMVRLISMTPVDYRAASFLDDRMMAETQRIAHVVSWGDAVSAFCEDSRRDARWIFHIGHVGSTLVSRLLGELPGVLALREPRLLRDLALAPDERRETYLDRIAEIMSRAFSGGETACVKTTSLVSEIAPQLVPPGERALFLYATPRRYIASILAGENSVKELSHLEAFRTQRMARRVGVLADTQRSDAHRAAAAWACEMTSLEAAVTVMPDRRIAWADFDTMLDDMAGSIRTAASHFDFAAADEDLTRITSGPLMRRYSKAMEYDYSPSLRRDLIDEASTLHRSNIDSARAMLDRAAATSPLLARALDRAGEN